MLTTFDGRYFWLHGILPSIKVQLGGKTMSIKVEVVDAPLDYNLLLGQTWIYAMKAIVSSIFHVICFPFDDQIVTIDHMSFDSSSSIASSGSTIPTIDNSQPVLECICH